MLTSSASRGVRSGSSAGRRAASMDLPAPGGPTSSRLWPPAAAISSARRAVSMPFTSARSGPGGTSAAPAGSGGASTWVPRKWLMSDSRSVGASTSMRPANAASPTCAPGQISPRSRADAPIAAGSTPATGFSEPSSESSPSAANPPTSSRGSTAIAASTQSAMGRSKWLPSFSRSAGARLISTRLGGRASPIAVSAARTRSRASPTALSGSPTTRKAGRPEEICTCTSTGIASIPEKAKDWIRAMVMGRSALQPQGLQDTVLCAPQSRSACVEPAEEAFQQTTEHVNIVAALLHDRRRGAESADCLAGSGEAVRRHRERVQRLVFGGVEAEADHQRVGREITNGVDALGHRFEPAGVAGAEYQGQIQIAPGAGPLAALMGTAGEPGIVAVGVAVDRDEQHVAPVPENTLRAVAVMAVDVEDRDPAGATGA